MDNEILNNPFNDWSKISKKGTIIFKFSLKNFL